MPIIGLATKYRGETEAKQAPFNKGPKGLELVNRKESWLPDVTITTLGRVNRLAAASIERARIPRNAMTSVSGQSVVTRAIHQPNRRRLQATGRAHIDLVGFKATPRQHLLRWLNIRVNGVFLVELSKGVLGFGRA